MVYELQVVYLETIRGAELVKGVSSTRIKINSSFELDEILKNPSRLKTVQENLARYPQGIEVRISRSELLQDSRKPV